MLHLCDTPVNDTDAGTLVELLHRSGRADDLTASTIIENALSRKALSAPLTPEERDAILSVLEDPTEGLEDLRGALARDHRDRDR
jgi:hypothetical protein